MWKYIAAANQAAKRIVPAKLAARFPAIPPLVLVAVFLSACIIVVTVGWNLTVGAHDLSGSYQTADFFPVNQITFEKDGTFTAISYSGDVVDTLYGTYRKVSSGEYRLSFTGGDSGSGNPVTRYEVSSIGNAYELSAKKVNEQTLLIEVIPKLDYWAWNGKTSYFYK